jgi:hypothetical protein
MKVGSLVTHKSYFGLGVVVNMRTGKGWTKSQFKVHWLREGKDFGWAWVDDSVEVLCK